jgi:hypothetical protein
VKRARREKHEKKNEKGQCVERPESIFMKHGGWSHKREMSREIRPSASFNRLVEGGADLRVVAHSGF